MPYWLITRALELTPLRSVQKVCATKFKCYFFFPDVSTSHVPGTSPGISVSVFVRLFSDRRKTTTTATAERVSDLVMRRAMRSL